MKYRIEGINEEAERVLLEKNVDMTYFSNESDALDFAQQLEDEYGVEFIVLDEEDDYRINLEGVKDSALFDKTKICYAMDWNDVKWNVKPIWATDKLATMEDGNGNVKKVLIDDLLEFYHLYDENDEQIWDCSECDNDDVEDVEEDMYWYFIPQSNLNEDDIKEMCKYDIKIVGKTDIDFVVYGKLDAITKYIEDYIGVGVVDDYLYDEEPEFEAVDSTSVGDTASLVMDNKTYDISGDNIAIEKMDGEIEEIGISEIEKYIEYPMDDDKFIVDMDTGVILYNFETGEMDSDLAYYLGE